MVRRFSFVPTGGAFDALCSILDRPRVAEGAADVFRHSTSRNDPAPPVFATDIGTQKMGRDLQNTDTPRDELPGALERAFRTPFRSRPR